MREWSKGMGCLDFLTKVAFIIAAQTRGASSISKGLSPGQQRLRRRIGVIDGKHHQSPKLRENKTNEIFQCITSGLPSRHKKTILSVCSCLKLWLHIYLHAPSNPQVFHVTVLK